MGLQKETYDPNGKVANKQRSQRLLALLTGTHTQTSQEVQPMFEVHRPGSQYLAVQVVYVRPETRHRGEA